MGFVARLAVLVMYAALVAGPGATTRAAAAQARTRAAPANLAAAQTPPSASFAQITGRTSTPWGWLDFCDRYQDECAGGPSAPADIELNPKVWALIKKVNEQVNHSIRPMADMDHWGVIDQWDLPLDGYGDCEDYALMKRHILIAQGLPRQALLMTVVKDENGEGHAILTVKTDHGEFILDNMREHVMPWEALPYVFVKRQSQADPDVWEQIGAPTPAPLTVSR